MTETSIQVMWLWGSVGILIILAGGLLFYYHSRRCPKKNIFVKRREPIITITIQPPQVAIANKKENSPLTATPQDDNEQSSRYDPNLIVLQLKAFTGKPYMGYELHQSILAAGLRFGAKNIFYRYNSDTEKILFSLAAATASGEFIIEDIGSFKCDGLVLFMPLDAKQNMANFDLMLDVARLLTEELGGEIYDELLQPLSSEVISRLREKICTVATNNLYVSDLLDNLNDD